MQKQTAEIEPVHFVDDWCKKYEPVLNPPERKTAKDYSREQIAALVLDLIFTYASYETPTVVLDGYDTIRNCPPLTELLGLQLKPNLEWPSDWEMVYDSRRVAAYGPNKGQPRGDLSVLLDVQVSNKQNDKRAKLRVGFDTIRSYFVDEDSPVWSWLLDEMERQLPGVSVAGY
jgi:hypothetical protein